MIGAATIVLLVLPSTPSLAAPSNDAFEAATPLFSSGDGAFRASGELFQATLQPGEPQPCGDISGSVWFRHQVTSESDVSLTVKVEPAYYSDVSPVGAVYEGTSLSTLDLKDCSLNREERGFRGRSGATYYIQVGATGDLSNSEFSIHVKELPVPPNDSRSDAALVSSVPFEAPQVQLERATLQANEPRPSCGTINTSVWYRISVPHRTAVSLDVPDLDGEVVAAVYRNSPDGLKEVACGRTVYGTEPAPLSIPHLGKAGLLQVAGVRDKPTSVAVEITDDEPCPACLPPCQDTAFNLRTRKMPARQVWLFNPKNTPTYLTKGEVERALKNALATLTKAKNDCGMPDRVSIKAEYGGRTSRRASSCQSQADHVQVIEFKTKFYPLGLQCTTSGFDFDRNSGNLKGWVDSDIWLAKSPVWGERWTTDPDAPSCHTKLNGFALDIEAVILHELAHSWTLDHVAGRHSNMTMNDGAGYKGNDWRCNGGYRTLGRGDILGLQKRY